VDEDSASLNRSGSVEASKATSAAHSTTLGSVTEGAKAAMDSERVRSAMCVLLAVRCSGAGGAAAAAAEGAGEASCASCDSTGVGARDEQTVGDRHSDREGSAARCASLLHVCATGCSAEDRWIDSGLASELCDGDGGAVGGTRGALSVALGCATDGGLVGGEFASDMPIGLQTAQRPQNPRPRSWFI
jgi:hypothetical protein